MKGERKIRVVLRVEYRDLPGSCSSTVSPTTGTSVTGDRSWLLRRSGRTVLTGSTTRLYVASQEGGRPVVKGTPTFPFFPIGQNSQESFRVGTEDKWVGTLPTHDSSRKGARRLYP